MKVTILLPWPDKTLSPNARVHWSKLAKAKKVARELAAKECIAANLHIHKHVLFQNGLALRLGIMFCVPDKRRRDLDNVIASFKAYQDGIADILAVDDSHFVPTYQFFDLPDFCGVRVTIEGAA